MKMKPTIPMLAALTAAVLVAGVAGAVALASGSASTHSSAVVIRHQLHGCHMWSVNGGAYKASQTVSVQRGGWITVTNNDVMPHKLVQTSGPTVAITRLKTGTAGLKGTFAPAMLARMGSAAKVTFAKAGVYKFTTKAGEDYMSGIKTIGADNVLKLTVVVS